MGDCWSSAKTDEGESKKRVWTVTEPQKPPQKKILLLGASATGKSALIQMCTKGDFGGSEVTCGVEAFRKLLTVNGKREEFVLV
jgi:GTPase SAR1 family protein